MRSTGEVMGLDTAFGTAFAKSQIGSAIGVPDKGTVLFPCGTRTRKASWKPCAALRRPDFQIIATGGTQKYLEDQGIR